MDNDELDSAKIKIQVSTAELERTIFLLFSVIASDVQFLNDLQFVLSIPHREKTIREMIDDRFKKIKEELVKL